ncbi:MAG: replicative DNA helicase [Flavobacteriales bacterium]|nr:replicative DNA helicase [Flavobacteriales bacterium]
MENTNIEKRIQPQAVELEVSVLGAVLIDNEAIDDCLGILKKEYFYKIEHQLIFEAITNLINDSNPVDILTVTEELKRLGNIKKAGGASYVAQLSSRVSSSANTEYHARIISEKYIQRKLINICSVIIQESLDDTIDVFSTLNKAESELFNVTEGTLKKSYESMSNLINIALTNIENLKTQEHGMTGVPSGFSKLDDITSGWQRSDLVIIAARPGMGKTAFALSIARNIAVNHEIGVAIFSLEMSSEQLVNRLISSESEINAGKLRKGDLADHEWVQLHSKIKGLSKANIYIDDTPAISVFELRAKARRLVKSGVKIIIVDYLQLMTAGGKGGNREQEISMISRSLKGIAKELSIPILALSQVNRSLEQRSGVGSKRPMLSDLRESGAIEQDADIVTFIYRPEYYKIQEWENGDSCLGQAEIIIAKHRNGRLGDFRLNFKPDFAKFAELSDFPNLSPVGTEESMLSISSSMNESTEESE